MDLSDMGRFRVPRWFKILATVVAFRQYIKTEAGWRIAGWTLFAIVFFWQPPHVWAIALYRKDDYKAAGIPMPPEVIGDEATRRRVVAYTAGLLPVTLAPFFLGLVGPLYFAVACPMGLWFLYRSYRLFQERTDDAARDVFRVSLVFLGTVFMAMLLDLLVPL